MAAAVNLGLKESARTIKQTHQPGSTQLSFLSHSFLSLSVHSSPAGLLFFFEPLFILSCIIHLPYYNIFVSFFGRTRDIRLIKMRSTRALFTSAMLAVANAQGVIVKAVGDKGTSTGLQGLSHCHSLHHIAIRAHADQPQ